MEEDLESDLREMKRKGMRLHKKKKVRPTNTKKTTKNLGEGQLRAKPCVESMDNRYCAWLIGGDEGNRVPANTPCG